MNDMLDDIDPVDAYQAWVERKRARDAEAPEIEVKPTFTEEEANILAALIENTRDQFKTDIRLKLMSVLAKLDRAIGAARSEAIPR